MNEKTTPQNQSAGEPEQAIGQTEARLRRLAIEGLESSDGGGLTSDDRLKIRADLELRIDESGGK